MTDPGTAAVRPEREGDDTRVGVTAGALAQAVLDKLYFDQARTPQLATLNDWYFAAAHAVRDRILQRWVRGLGHLAERDLKVVAYLSAEFLLGPQLGNNLSNLGIAPEFRKALAKHSVDLDALLRHEPEPGLGNGGLGRLAACYMDSLATLDVPAIGYGIRYEFGIFEQRIRDGAQVEVTDSWLHLGNPWEIPRPELTYEVGLGGRTEAKRDAQGRYRVHWTPAHVVRGAAYDTQVLGYRSKIACVLRLWRAGACESFDFQAFNHGDYWGAVEDKVQSETLSKVLYPNDELQQGKRLRLEQQYFFVSCSLQDMLHVLHLVGEPLQRFPDKFAAQLNDTHPSIAVAELMRLLVDVHAMDWDEAWSITQRTFGYTNHTLLPEALERWPLPLFAEVLPRHLEIVFEINRRFLDEVRARAPGDEERVRRMSLIDESGPRFVRMAHLAAVGSHAINGVAALHTRLLRESVMRDFAELYPDKFLNVTNGVTPRRWLLSCNPRLASLITETIGDRWIKHPEEELPALASSADDAAFQERWRAAKRANKLALATLLAERTGVAVDPDTLFDVQVKRIHEYKRQHLAVLHVIAVYHRLKAGLRAGAVPRTVVFGGKAAPGYAAAKSIIRLIHAVGETINADAELGGLLKVAFLPNFNVKNGELVYPAADLSEQISTAGFEASGTGNMKFGLNGALTIGTLDGANVEIREAVGDENFFLFGLTAAEVAERKRAGYRPRGYYDSDDELRGAIDAIADGRFSHGDRSAFAPLVAALLERDDFLVLADFRAYADCQARVDRAWRDPRAWTRMSILNVARMGRFSSDRSIREYCDEIWHVRPV